VAELISSLRPVGDGRNLRRFGPNGDGGYLMPDDLEGVTAAVSPGVSVLCGFDLDIAQRGIDVYMADASVEGPPVSHPKFHFEKKFVDIYSSETTVEFEQYCRAIPGYANGDDLILQMDIEGAEYRVLSNVSEATLSRFRIVILELHRLDLIFLQSYFSVIEPVFKKLLRNHRVVHIHPNNTAGSLRRGKLEIPRHMEFTFVRKDRLGSEGNDAREYPHPLDVDCVPENPHYALPTCWR